MDLPDLRTFDVTDPIFMINFQDFKSRNKTSIKHPNVLQDGTMQVNEKRVFLGSSFEFPKLYIAERCNTIQFDCEEIPLLINCVRTTLIKERFNAKMQKKSKKYQTASKLQEKKTCSLLKISWNWKC